MKAILWVMLALLGAGVLIVFVLAYWNRRPVQDDDLINGGSV